MKGLVMKKLLLLMVCLAFLPVANAEEKPADISNLLQRSSLEVGPDAYYYQYKEPSVDVKETGVFWGVSGAYTYREWAPTYPAGEADIKWMFRAEARFDWGLVDYDGALWDGTPYEYDNIRDNTGEFRLLLGVDFPKETLMDTIYVGVGDRFLNEYKSGDPSGYDRSSNYLYLPVGVSTVRYLTGDWLLAATAEFDVFLWGRQSTDLGDFGLGTINNRQNGGYGLRGAVSFEKKGKTADFTIEPFIRYWNIDKSEVDADTGGYEPKNNTTELGLDLIWKF
jgi:hypothetical protein